MLWLYCVVKGTRLVVDWHNYSHTILQVITYKCINDGDEKYFDSIVKNIFMGVWVLYLGRCIDDDGGGGGSYKISMISIRS